MSAAGYGGYVRLHDHWFTDPAIADLLAEGRHDAVVWFLAAIAWSHAHNTDGRLPIGARSVLDRLANAPGSVADRLPIAPPIDPPIDALTRAQLLVIHKGGKGGSTLRIRSYDKWQTMADQRKPRKSTGTPARVQKRRGEKRKEESAAPVLDMDELYRRASEKIIRLEADA